MIRNICFATIVPIIKETSENVKEVFFYGDIWYNELEKTKGKRIMEEERIINGFCKSANDIRTIFCEYDEEGTLTHMDCAGHFCELKESCENYKKALAREGSEV